MGLPEHLWGGFLARKTGKADPMIKERRDAGEDVPFRQQEKESGIQIDIARYLDARGFFFFAVPNERKASVVALSILKAMGMLKGITDLVVINRDGRAGFIEVKTATGKLSDAQREVRDECRRRGFPWGLARSVDDVAELLGEWGFEP